LVERQFRGLKTFQWNVFNLKVPVAESK